MSTSSPPPTKILLVEDDPDLRRLLTHFLRARGRDDVHAHETAVGLEEAIRHGDYDLLILDWMLPELSGLELCRRVRASTDAYILMLTARDGSEDLDRILEAGADDYVAKPVPLPLLEVRLRIAQRNILERRRSRHLHRGNELILQVAELAATARRGVEDLARDITRRAAEALESEACGVLLARNTDPGDRWLPVGPCPVDLLRSSRDVAASGEIGRTQTPDGRHLLAVPLHSADGPVGAFGMLRAASWTSADLQLVGAVADRLASAVLRERDRLALQISEERYAMAARGSRDVLWDWDLVADRIYLSDRWFEIFGAPHPGRLVEPDEWLSRLHPADRTRLQREIAGHLRGRTPHLESEVRVETSTGYRWLLVRGTAFLDESREPVRLSGSQTDVTDQRLTDHLTGLPNRRLLLDRIDGAIRRSRRQPRKFALLSLDLDRFQRFNDGYDHRTGDAILRETARRLGESVRSQDTAACLGADGFAVLVDPLPTQPRTAAAICERILDHVRQPIRVNDDQLVVTASLGLAIGTPETTASDLLRDAEAAMETAKKSGGNRFSTFSPSLRRRALRAVELEARLRDAFQKDELTNHFQPIVELETQRTRAIEALTRWSHPELGLVSPGEFIPIAEEVGLIVQIGEWALRDACEHLAGWKRTGRLPDVSMSVNVSVRQFESPGFLPAVEEALRLVDASRLRLEITESAVISSPRKAEEILDHLHGLGIGIALDDFGTGYSSLSYLHRFPFDVLKVDRSFVGRMIEDPQSRQIVRTIVDLGRSLGLTLVAEGIETEAQLAMLLDLGCELGQGFLFSKALPDADLVDWHAARSPD